MTVLSLTTKRTLTTVWFVVGYAVLAGSFAFHLRGVSPIYWVLLAIVVTVPFLTARAIALKLRRTHHVSQDVIDYVAPQVLLMGLLTMTTTLVLCLIR
jgi:hypothetical protein